MRLTSNTAPLRIIILMLSFATTACDSDSHTAPRSMVNAGPAAYTMPALEIAYISTDVALSPVNIRTGASVGIDGSILLATDGSQGDRLIRLDSTGTLVSRFGKTGEGPGELRAARPVGLAGDAALVYDLSQMQISRFDRAGNFAGSVKLGRARGFPMFLIDDHVALVVMPGPSGSRPGTLDLQSGDMQYAVSESDSVAARIVSQTTSEGRQPTVGWWAGGPLIADGGNYELAMYDTHGNLVQVLQRSVRPPSWTPARAETALEEFRSSPPGQRASAADIEAKRAELLDSKLPHFYHTTAPSPDGNGRLWILGQEADSAYADVFSPDDFLGRLAIGCPGFSGGWSVRGQWLALTCRSTDPEYEGDAVLHLFRIQ